MMKDLIVYVHGYGGSKNSSTAAKIAEHMQEISNGEVEVVALDYEYMNPTKALKSLHDQIAEMADQYSNIIVLGNSLGGYYADLLAKFYPELVDILLLINPSLNAPENCVKYIGEVVNWKNNKYTIRGNFALELADIANGAPESYAPEMPVVVFLGMADTVVDPKHTVAVMKERAEIVRFKGEGHVLNIDRKVVERIYKEINISQTV